MSQNETVPGGKYLAADGKTFVDAWGVPISDQGDAEHGTPLSKLSRAGLESMAVEAGMSAEDAKKAKNIPALVEFIESQTAPLSEQDGEES